MDIGYIEASLTRDWTEVGPVNPGAEFLHTLFLPGDDGKVAFFFTGGKDLSSIGATGPTIRNLWVAKFAYPRGSIVGGIGGYDPVPDGTVIVNPDGYGEDITIGTDSVGNPITANKVVYLYHAAPGEIIAGVNG